MKPLIYINPIRLLKTPHYYPLWKRHVVYPKYNVGDPQLRIPLVPYWMKMIFAEGHNPPDIVKFKVHPQMTNHDVREYLIKIYDVTPMSVKTKMKYNDLKPLVTDENSKKILLEQIFPHQTPPKPERYEKVAYVRLMPGDKFVFPRIFDKNQPELQATDEEQKAFKKSGWFH